MTEPPQLDRIDELRRRLGLEDADPSLIALALRHTSHVREGGRPDTDSNERLEFLGDAVLDLVLADYLFTFDAELSEGELTRLKSTLAQEAALARVGRRLGLGEFLALGRGEEDSGGRQRASLIADAVEALIAAVYLSGGLPAARQFVLTHFAAEIDEALDAGPAADPKTALQELIQEQTRQLPTYRTVSNGGPAHEPSFRAECRFAGVVIGSGIGRSKREAEKAAARSALADPDAVHAAVVHAPNARP
ncbi:MAG: ribonuclease III [Armatimonadetes bacterium]|nr:ribonuclease III [Armatimonadota bacterium]